MITKRKKTVMYSIFKYIIYYYQILINFISNFLTLKIVNKLEI